MKQFKEIKELSTTHPNAKPVVAEMMQNGCWKIVSHSTDRDGYVQLRRNGRMQGSHRLSYEAFIGEITWDLCCLHKCDNPPCVNPSHLFLGTRKDNNQDCVKKGRGAPQKGESNPNSKLTESQVRKIRSLQGSLPQEQIGKMFKVKKAQISNIQNNKSWNHVTKNEKK